MKLCVIPRSVMITYNRSASDRISHKNRNEDKIHIHNDSKRSHTVCTCKFHQLKVIKNIHKRRRQIRHHFRRTVHACFQKNIFIQFRSPSDPQPIAASFRKKEKRRDPSYDLSHSCSDRSSCHSPLKYCDKQVIKHNVRQSGRNIDLQAQNRLFRGNEKALKHILQNKRRLRRKKNSSVYDAMFQKFAIRFEHPGNLRRKDKTDNRKNNADDNTEIKNHRKILIRFFLLTFPKRFATMALPPVPSINPIAAIPIDTGQIRFVAANGIFPT